jgi:hypothetical protein
MAITKAQQRDLFPGEIEGLFRENLGKVNQYLTVLELSARSFDELLKTQASEAQFMRNLAKRHGFHSFYPEQVTHVHARKYLLSAHMAYLFSAGDVLCKAIRADSHIKSLKRENKEQFNEFDKGDFLTKTLALCIWSSAASDKNTTKEILATLTKLQIEPCFATVNYYRLIRNEELHEVDTDSGNRASNAFSLLPLQQIVDCYHLSPHQPSNLTPDDVLLCSKAWQDVALWLCRHMLSEGVCRSMIEKRYGFLTQARRINGASAFMKQALLFNAVEINDMISTLGW